MNITHSKEFIKDIHDKYYPEIAKQVRKDLKQVFGKDFKFSVRTRTYAGGGAIDINIMTGKIDFYTKEYIEAKREAKLKNTSELWEKVQNLYSEHGKNVCVINGKDYKKRTLYTIEGKKSLDEIKKVRNLYNHDNSELMTDYFDVNYYGDVEIGRRDKEYIKI